MDFLKYKDVLIFISSRVMLKPIDVNRVKSLVARAAICDRECYRLLTGALDAAYLVYDGPNNEDEILKILARLKLTLGANTALRREIFELLTL